MGNCAGKKIVSTITIKTARSKMPLISFKKKPLTIIEMNLLENWQLANVPSLNLLKNSLYKNRTELLRSKVY